MSTLLHRRIELLSHPNHAPLLLQGLRGIERESLRATTSAHLAQSSHPRALGAALTHPFITTDYAEALTEFITPAMHDIADALTQLEAIHRFTYAHLDHELLWSQSMPCLLPPDDEIVIAWYGTSNPGMLKHVYRRGLALRYGKAMQCIAGIHYNFSLAEPLWQVLKTTQPAGEVSSGCTDDAIAYQSESYIAMIRNFRRYSWLLMYLFGASPALAANFLRESTHRLERLSDDTLFLPYATSLRMSDLGYQNNAQAGLSPHENSLNDYVTTLSAAVNKPYPPYAEIGLQKGDAWVQLSTNVLQIENEYYSTIRPKRVLRSGERAIQALCRRGVQYVEVRCMDVDPYQPVGISLQTARFLDVFLMFCALDASPLNDDAERRENGANFNTAVKEGRRPGLLLYKKGEPMPLQEWGMRLLEQFKPIAQLLDAQHGDDRHSQALAVQRQKLENPDLTPSAQVLKDMAGNGNSFLAFGLRQSELHKKTLQSQALTAQERERFAKLAFDSHQEQVEIEQAQSGDFDKYLAAYRDSTLSNPCD